MMVWERAGLFFGSRVYARMGFTKLGTWIHLTFGNLVLTWRAYTCAAGLSASKATPSRSTL